MSIDPVDPDTNNGSAFNRFAYAVNSPYSYIDPDGREEEKNDPDKRDRQIEEQLREERGRLCGTGQCSGTTVQSSDTGNDSPLGSYLPWTGAGDNAAQYWAALQVQTGNEFYSLPGTLASLWTPDTAIRTATTLLTAGVASWGIRLGRELSFGRDLRLAPFGNRTGNKFGELPHYHRRGMDPATGQTRPGQGIARHRPWEKRSTDKSFFDRF